MPKVTKDDLLAPIKPSCISGMSCGPAVEVDVGEPVGGPVNEIVRESLKISLSCITVALGLDRRGGGERGPHCGGLGVVTGFRSCGLQLPDGGKEEVPPDEQEDLGRYGPHAEQAAEEVRGDVLDGGVGNLGVADEIAEQLLVDDAEGGAQNSPRK